MVGLHYTDKLYASRPVTRAEPDILRCWASPYVVNVGDRFARIRKNEQAVDDLFKCPLERCTASLQLVRVVESDHNILIPPMYVSFHFPLPAYGLLFIPYWFISFLWSTRMTYPAMVTGFTVTGFVGTGFAVNFLLIGAPQTRRWVIEILFLRNPSPPERSVE